MTQRDAAAYINVTEPVPKIEVQCRSWFADAHAAGPAAVFWTFWAVGLGLTAGATTTVLAGIILSATVRNWLGVTL